MRVVVLAPVAALSAAFVIASSAAHAGSTVPVRDGLAAWYVELGSARRVQIERLRDYAAAGRFPRNVAHPRDALP